MFDISAYNGNGLPGTCLNTDVCIEVLRLLLINPAVVNFDISEAIE